MIFSPSLSLEGCGKGRSAFPFLVHAYPALAGEGWVALLAPVALAQGTRKQNASLQGREW